MTPAARCLRIIASLNLTSKGFLKLVADILMRWRMHSLMRSKKAGGIMAKFGNPEIPVASPQIW